MIKKTTFCCALIVWFHNLSAQEQAEQVEETPTQQLEEVVISDARFPLQRKNSGKTVIKIIAKELEQHQGQSLATIINTKSGIEINGSRSNAGQNLGTFIRGGNNRQVLVIIDGIQVSDPSNVSAEYDLRLLHPSQIESVEILKGAASTLYGNAAATAVINITTKKAKKEGMSATFDSSIGTNRSQDDTAYNIADFTNHVSLYAKKGKLSLSTAFGHRYTDGLSAVIGEERDPFSRINGNIRLGYRITERLNIETYAAYDKFRAAFDRSFPIADANFNSFSEQLRFGIASTFKYTGGSLHGNVALNKIDRRIQSSFPQDYDSESIVVDLFNNYRLNDRFYTIAGLNYIKNNTVFSETEHATTIDPYANVVFLSGFGLHINAGLRWNNHSQYGNHITYNFNPSYLMDVGKGTLKIMGSYATSFIAPNLSQLFGPFGANLQLQPEENTTIEGGLEFQPSTTWRMSAVYFHRKEVHFIDYVIVDFDTFRGEYQNVDEEFTSHGVEFEMDVKPTEALSMALNYTFTERQREVRLRLPKHKLNATLGYQITKNTFGSLSYSYTSSRLDTDFVNFQNVTLEGFGLLDVYLNHQVLQDRLKLFARVSNIFNESYTEIIGFTTRGSNINLGFQLQL